MTLRPALALVVPLAALALAGPSAAQDKDKSDPAVQKAKAAALENLKKANVTKPTVVETANFLVVGSISEDKAKALGEALEKTSAAARKGLKMDDKEAAWKGKLTVYFVPDNGEFKALMRRAFQTPPEGLYADLRAEPPVLVDPAEVSGKATDADLYANTAARVAGELLKAKGTGTQVIPDWLRDGFGRVAVARAEGTTSKRYQAYRAQARAAVAKGAKLDDVWSETKSATGDALAASFADYLIYGPGAAKFPMIFDALRPSENNQTPTVQQALEAAGLKDKDKGFVSLEAAWRKWSAGK